MTDSRTVDAIADALRCMVTSTREVWQASDADMLAGLAIETARYIAEAASKAREPALHTHALVTAFAERLAIEHQQHMETAAMNAAANRE